MPDPTSTPVPRPGGRTARTRRQVFDAARALFVELGPAEITVQHIAARSGVHESTIYRRWGSKEGVLTEVLLEISGEQLVAPDTGSLRSDLIELLGAVASFLRTPEGYALAYLAATADDESSAVMRDAFWADRFQRAQVLFDRAEERGEIRSAALGRLAYEMLIGTLHFRLIGQRATLEEGIEQSLVDLVLRGLDR